MKTERWEGVKMTNKHYLVIGASSVAGQKAIEAIRRKDPGAKLTITTSKSQIDNDFATGYNVITGIDLAKPEASQQISSALTESVDVLIFCPAFGMVGYPAEFAPLADVEACIAFSVKPLLSLIEQIKPTLTLAFSSFYWLRSLEIAYGSMAFAKYALERLSCSYPQAVHIVRAGLFPSKSLRGICLLIQRAVQKEAFPGAAELKAGWKASGLGFSDYFTQFAQGHERLGLAQYCAQYRPTEEADLVRAIAIALETDAPPIVNVVGDTLWQESNPYPTPEFMQRNAAALAYACRVVDTWQAPDFFIRRAIA